MNVVNIVPMLVPPPPPSPKPAQPHVSVMPREIVQALDPRPGTVFVDATLGAGGHTELLLEGGATVVGLDRDPTALKLAGLRLARFGTRFMPVHSPFSGLEAALEERGLEGIDGLLADVGVSSMQLDDPGRGMSFRAAGPHDMRMDPTSGLTALELIDSLDDEELADVIYRYGEERRSRRIARCIKQAREADELHTTLDLRRAVVRAVGPARVGGVDPATRTFQALRIRVNGELDELGALLDQASRVLRPGGVVAILSFHSLEDRIAKRALRERSLWQPLSKKPLVPTDEECAENPRARSAKLRTARRLDPTESRPHLRLFEGRDDEDEELPEDEA
jgi:16S rRNA (cytosine1402-N4)-methyltransferase